MADVYHLPFGNLNEVKEEKLHIKCLSGVYYDTSTPPPNFMKILPNHGGWNRKIEDA